MESPTKILAASDHELMIISACLQDALVSLKNTSYDKKNKRFTLLANRYQWEKSAGRKGLRTHTAIAFDHVDAVQTNKVVANIKGLESLSLLNIAMTNDKHVILTFSEDVKIRLQITQLKIKLRDEGAPWPARAPKHPQ